jgi:hypothetical protein
MRILRDVVVDLTSRDELMALCQVPGVVGETMTVDLMGGGIAMGLRVTVLESRPVVMDGSVRHRLRLGLIPLEGRIGRASSAESTDVPAEVS